MRTVHSVVGAFVALGVVTIGASALAAGGGIKQEKGKLDQPPAAGGTATLGSGDEMGTSAAERNQQRTEKKGEEEKEGEEDRPFSIWLTRSSASASRTSCPRGRRRRSARAGTGNLAAPTIDQAKIATYSLIAGASYEFAKGIEGGLRVPLSLGTISSDENRGTAALGNIELEGAYELQLSPMMDLALALGVSLPTAQASQIVDPVPVVGGGIRLGGLRPLLAAERRRGVARLRGQRALRVRPPRDHPGGEAPGAQGEVARRPVGEARESRRDRVGLRARVHGRARRRRQRRVPRLLGVRAGAARVDEHPGRGRRLHHGRRGRAAGPLPLRSGYAGRGRDPAVRRAAHEPRTLQVSGSPSADVSDRPISGGRISTAASAERTPARVRCARCGCSRVCWRRASLGWSGAAGARRRTARAPARPASRTLRPTPR